MISKKNPKIIAIVPAYNEEGQIAGVLSALTETNIIDEIIVINDGSEDKTSKVAKVFPIILIDHKVNHGKGAALQTGISYALKKEADILAFFDADLVGLTPNHINELIKPLLVEKKLLMSVGVFIRNKKKNKSTTVEYSGQRAMKKFFFKDLIDLTHTGFGVEITLTDHLMKIAKNKKISESKLRTKVYMKNIIHVTKEKKYGPLEGFGARIKMGLEIGLTPLDLIKNNLLKKTCEVLGIDYKDLLNDLGKKKLAKKVKRDYKRAKQKAKIKEIQNNWKKLINGNKSKQKKISSN